MSKQGLQSVSDEDLESMWQASANEIGFFIKKSWNCPPKEEERWREKAEQAQKRQEEVQREITRRH